MCQATDVLPLATECDPQPPSGEKSVNVFFPLRWIRLQLLANRMQQTMAVLHKIKNLFQASNDEKNV